MVALSGHDSTPWATTRSRATATAPCAPEKNCGSPPRPGDAAALAPERVSLPATTVAGWDVITSVVGQPTESVAAL
jgi:hypothetical protein